MFHPISLFSNRAFQMCCTVAKSCSSKRFELVLSFVFLTCEHPEEPPNCLFMSLVQPYNLVLQQPVCQCKYQKNNLQKNPLCLCTGPANCSFIKVLSLLGNSALTLVRHVVFSAVKLMKNYKNPTEMHLNSRWCTSVKNPQVS